MPFLRANIDRAIVLTQYDLRGFLSPAGYRAQKMASAKLFDAATGNFIAWAAGLGGDRKPTDSAYVGYFESSFDEYLAMCKRLAAQCDLYQKEAIRLIVLEIVKQNEEMRAKVAAGEMEPSNYLKPLEKDNRWGRAVLSLAEAFGVNVDFTRPLTVERIVRKLAELSENGTKAVCLTCEDPNDLARKNFAHDHSDKIEEAARATYPFFRGSLTGGFWLGSRGYFWVPRSVLDRGDTFPGWNRCVNFPIAEV